MKIKVCGMRDAENIRAVETLGIDYMGFIFWPRSARYVGEVPAYLPEQCKRVGVFVDASLEDILASAESFRLDCIQFHGNESPGTIAAVRKVVNSVNPSISIIKSLSISESEDLRQTAMYEDVCDAFLFDTKGKLPGGNGRQFDWNLLQKYDGRLPFLLSGGIGPEDAERIKAFSAPGFAGVDLNSRFETAPGLKDVTALKSFIEQLKQ
jgi:phosphoribosylanthranilate isomerase